MKANLTTICNIDTQEEIRAFLNKFFSGVEGLTAQKRNQIVLAVDEAIANAIIHGNDSDPEKSIQLDIDVNKKRIHIELSDIGLFDEIMNNDKKDKELKEVIKDKQKGGLGLKLIYSIMDVVCFYTQNNKSYCLMVKLM
jgi:serine/threonine-protein kinase RsbW